MSSQQVTVDGQRIALTNRDKVLYPATGTTKGEVIDYYQQIAPVMLPHLRQRAITRKRYPDGVGTGDGEQNVFFAKDLPAGTPDWVRRFRIQHSRGANDYPVADDAATLVWLAQLAALELHVPQWRFADDGTALPPDRLVFDLDPGEGVELAACAEVAGWVRELLDSIGLTCYPVTSGSKGIHLYAHLDGSLDTIGASEVAKQIAQTLQAAHPDRVTAVMRKADRGGRVFLDWSQNNGNKTTVAPYSLRGRARPWVAAPRTWDELGASDLRQLEFGEVLERVARDGDLFAPLAPEATDRLSTYRGMRDAAKTPEPVPAGAPAATAGDSFVIQEHHARRLHWDFRLERDGVLVSWAVPKGPPTDPKSNHLAVHVEDHPLAYGGFEGTIPKGEYGAGTVQIWDAGRYEVEKWRDGEEIIVTLHGRSDGGLGGQPATFALIHTDKDNWLIHRMAPSPTPTAVRPAVRPAAPAPLERPLRPMLATIASPSAISDEGQWAFEMKWDGVRALAEVTSDGSAHLTSRNGRDETSRYPDLLPDLRHLGCDAVLDGEIIATDAKGVPRFGLLQPRINLTRASEIAAAAAAQPVQYLLFDLLELDGISLAGLPYEQRRELLEQLVPGGLDRVQVPPVFDGDLLAALDASSTLQLEGVMAKRLGSRYRPGRRTDDWLKIKHHASQSVVVSGWRAGEGSRASTLGSLLVAVPDGGRLRYVGRVGTGFDTAGLTEAAQRLAELAVNECALVDVPDADARDAHWVRPVLVGEVRHAGLSGSGKLWHPVWLGWRPDLAPGDVHWG